MLPIIAYAEKQFGMGGVIIHELAHLADKEVGDPFDPKYGYDFSLYIAKKDTIDWTNNAIKNADNYMWHALDFP